MTARQCLSGIASITQFEIKFVQGHGAVTFPSSSLGAQSSGSNTGYNQVYSGTYSVYLRKCHDCCANISNTTWPEKESTCGLHLFSGATVWWALPMLTNMSLIRGNMAQWERRCGERPTSMLSCYHNASCPCCSPHYFPRASLHLSISHIPQRMRYGILLIIPPYIFKTLTFIFKIVSSIWWAWCLKSIAVTLGHGLLITELRTPNL